MLLSRLTYTLTLQAWNGIARRALLPLLPLKMFSEGQACECLCVEASEISLLGSPEEQGAMNNECLFVRTLFSGQPKLFLLYGKSTLGDIFPNHITGCVRWWRLPNAGDAYHGSTHCGTLSTNCAGKPCSILKHRILQVSTSLFLWHLSKE